jgi:hypothetical protein
LQKVALDQHRAQAAQRRLDTDRQNIAADRLSALSETMGAVLVVGLRLEICRTDTMVVDRSTGMVLDIHLEAVAEVVFMAQQFLLLF